MTTIVVDAGLRTKLLATAEVAEFRDETGKLLGRFFPVDHPDEDVEIALSEAELQQRLAPDCKTYTTAEVLSELAGTQMSVVEWAESARDELADIYVQATPSERDLIESVILVLERDLADAPRQVGESRVGHLRFETRQLLAFWFRVSSPGDLVRIIRVTRPRRK